MLIDMWCVRLADVLCCVVMCAPMSTLDTGGHTGPETACACGVRPCVSVCAVCGLDMFVQGHSVCNCAALTRTYVCVGVRDDLYHAIYALFTSTREDHIDILIILNLTIAIGKIKPTPSQSHSTITLPG